MAVKNLLSSAISVLVYVSVCVNTSEITAFTNMKLDPIDYHPGASVSRGSYRSDDVTITDKFF